SAFNAWIFSKSLETLPVSMDRHCSSALKLAQMLDEHAEIEVVRYLHLRSHPQYDLAKKQMKQGGSIVAIIVKGGFDRAKQVLDAVEMVLITSNLGDSRSIGTHPASTTHSKLTEEERQAIGIYPGSIRVSVGLEDPEDIINDVKQAIERS